uniref:Uncharacterized protein n=1 Tax=Cacopsylla melanoneura TaxID=428564 RepID=A0A8D8ZDI9_9HEMI
MGEKKTEYYFLLYAPLFLFSFPFPCVFPISPFPPTISSPHFHIVLFPFVREVPLLTFLCVLFLSCMLEPSPTFLCVNPSLSTPLVQIYQAGVPSFMMCCTR